MSHSLKKNIFWQYGLQIAKYIFPFITIPYLTRVLGPDVYAVRAYILAAMTFAQVFVDYGFTYYGTKVIAESSGSIEKQNIIISSIIFLRLLICLVGAILVAAVTFFIPIMKANAIYVVCAYIGVCFKGMLPDFVFQGQEDMGIITRRYVGTQAVAILLIFTFVMGPNDLLLVPVFESLAALLALIWSWHNVFVRRNISLVSAPFKKLFSTFKVSTVFFLSNAATTVFTALTTLMIGIYINDPSQIAFWSVAMTAIQAIQSLYSPIINSVYPRICATRDYSLGKPFLLYGGCAVLVCTVVFALMGNIIMLVLGGEEYIAGSYIIPYVSPVLFFSYFGMMLGFPLLGSAGYIKQLTASSIVAAVFHIVCLFVLAFTGNFVIINIALLRCITEFLMMALRVFFVWNYLTPKKKNT